MKKQNIYFFYKILFLFIISISFAQQQASIKPIATGPFNTNEAFWVEVKVGDPNPVTDLYGISFKLKSKNTALSYVDGSAVAGTFLGASPLSFFQKVDSQTVDMAVTKTSAPGVDGSGIVAKAQFMASVSGNDTLILTDISAVDRNGDAIPFSDSIFVVSVIQPPRPPVFTKVLPDTNIAENQLIAFTYQGSDPDGQSVVFSLISGPSGLGVNSAGALTWTPSYTQAGSHKVIVSVSDGAFSVNDTATITVSDNPRPPVFTKVLSDTSIAENQSLAFTYQGSDPDGQPVSFALVNGPIGLKVDSTGKLTWTPSYTQAGIHLVIVSISDSVLSDRDTATITVIDYNRPPVFTKVLPDPDTTIHANQPFVFAYQGSDPDGQSVTFSLISGPTGLLVDSMGQLTWTPITTQTGTHQVIVSVSDGLIPIFDTSGMIVDIVKSVRENQSIPMEFSISQNYPNPFNPSTTIRYGLPADSRVSIRIFNILGQVVDNIVNSEQSEGWHETTWDPKIASGLYFYRIDAVSTSDPKQRFTQLKKMLLLK